MNIYTPTAKAIQEVTTAIKKITGHQTTEVKATPNLSLGDIAIPCFNIASQLHVAPAEAANNLAQQLNDNLPKGVSQIKAVGPYLNIFFDRKTLSEQIITEITKQHYHYGWINLGDSQLVMEEFSSPNTNKPQHLGHVRNNVLGETMANVLTAANYKVIKASVVNDRGIHICKSMLAYQKWGEKQTPESVNKKGDHFVGGWYVKFEQELELERQSWYTNHNLNSKTMTDQDQRQTETEFLKQSHLYQEAQAMLQQWEKGDKKVKQLWQQMNNWVYDGFKQTYQRLGITFDKIYYESRISERGKQVVLDGAKKDLFQKATDGSIIAKLDKFNLPDKVLLRADGTALYITNDISLAAERFADYPDIKVLLYIVASEQDLYFKQLFAILKLLNYPWADYLHHLSYGMVYLPEGKMKSREGKVVDADDIMDQVINLAKQELIARQQESEKKLTGEKIDRRAEIIGLTALKVFILKTNRASDITFNPAEAIDFNGRTGVNLLYSYARAQSILQKAGPINKYTEINEANDQEWPIIMALDKFPLLITESVKNYEPAILVNGLLDLAQSFNSFYHDSPILKAEPAVRDARLKLVQAFCVVMGNGLKLLGVELLNEM